MDTSHDAAAAATLHTRLSSCPRCPCPGPCAPVPQPHLPQLAVGLAKEAGELRQRWGQHRGQVCGAWGEAGWAAGVRTCIRYACLTAKEWLRPQADSGAARSPLCCMPMQHAVPVAPGTTQAGVSPMLRGERAMVASALTAARRVTSFFRRSSSTRSTWEGSGFNTE